MRFSIVILLVGFFSFIELNGQIFNVKTYGIEDGLVQSQVSVVYQDHFGMLWLGTGGGVSRFNGIKFEDYTSKEGLVSNRVLSIFEDEFNKMWIGTIEGLNIYDNKNTNSISNDLNKSAQVSLDASNGLPGERITSITSDKKGNILIGSNSGMFIVVNELGLFDSLKQNDKIKGVNISDRQGLPSSRVVKIFVDSKDLIWIGTAKGLVRYDIKSGKVVLVENEGVNDMIRDISEDGFGNIWVSTFNGIAKITNPKQTDDDFNVEFITHLTGRKFGDTRFAYFDSRNVLWTNCNGLVEILVPNNIGREVDLNKAVTKPFNGIETTVRTVYEDREGNLWFGTYGHGVVRFSGRQFESYLKSYGLAGTSVRALSEDQKGRIWVGTNKYVSIIHTDRGEHIENNGSVVMETLDKDKGLQASSIWSLHNDTRGWDWVGTSKGLWLNTGRKQYFFKQTDGLGDNVVLSIEEDYKGNLWFGTFGGLSYLSYEDIEKGSFKFKNYTMDDGLADDQVNSIKLDQSNDLWIGTKNGLSFFDEGTFTNYSESSGLPSNYVHSLTTGVKGGLWIATGKGVSYFDGLQFFNYSTKDGLSSDTPYLLEFDDFGNLWVGTNKGLDKLCFDKSDSLINVKHYGALEGFMGVETNSNAVLKDRYGDLWFGTIKGVVKLNLDYEQVNATKPITNINSVKINLVDTIATDTLQLNYYQNNLTFEFSAISLTVPEKIKYRYQLIGHDNKPIETNSNNLITYSNLTPGSYEFKVWACNNDGVWSTNPSNIYFIIYPPFWRTTWFYLLIGAVLVGSFYGFSQWRNRILTRKQQELVNLVDERTKQLTSQNEKLEEAFKEIENNRDEISEKNKDITASIRYAKHLQDVMLPSETKMREMLGEHFVINMPRDIVSGDFYWLNVVENKILFSVIDCTGHGVPGAFMSIVSNGLLNRATNEFQLNEPDEILNLINELSLINNKHRSEQFASDGMDIALCSVDENKVMTYSGAYNPCIVIKNGELIVLKPDKIPIGMPLDVYQSYTSQEIQLKKGDMIYLFSDGYADQFGGSDGKKMKTKRFREQLMKVHTLPIPEQRNHLLEFFVNWKRNHQQIDDVMVLGIRVE